jgi:hypothetical protein
VLEPVRPNVKLPALIASVSAMAPVVVLKTASSGVPLFQVEPVQLASVVFQLPVDAPLSQLNVAAWAQTAGRSRLIKAA